MNSRNEQQRLDAILRQEDDAMKRQSIAQAWDEVQRRQPEVLAELDQAIQALHKQRQDTDELMRTLAHRRDAVQALQLTRAEPPALDELRQLKQQLHDAHIELTVFQRVHNQSAGSGAYAPLADMTFGELSRLGFALSWPLVAGLVVVALILAVALRLALIL